MKTFAELKSFCERKGLRHELVPQYGTWTGGEHQIIGYRFGINNLSGRSASEWTWFKRGDTSLKDDSIFVFQERFNLRSGRSYYGCYEEENAIRLLNRW